MRTCTKCGVDKPNSEFASNGKFGLHTACKECARIAAKKWREDNPEIARERDRVKHAKHRVARLAKMREYSLSHALERAATERRRYEAKKEQIQERNYAYRKANPALVRAWNNSRRAVERKATPAWADYSKISEFYDLAARLTRETGETYHVDHVIPLRGKTVSGLHVQSNLRVIKAVENLKKGARHE